MPGTPQPPSLTPRFEPAPDGSTSDGYPEGRRPRIGVVNSVGLLVVAALVTFGLLVVAFAMALCGFAGSDAECADEYQVSWLALVGAAVVFLGVPALVARLRRDGRWLLVPVAEFAVVVLLFAVGGTL